MSSNNRFEIDMTNGPLMPKLISFSVPLMLSGILQLLFNAVDLIVIGRFAENTALAAVGSTTFLIHIFVNLFMGISLGTNVCAARFYASKDMEKMSDVVHTSILTALCSGIVLLILGIVLAPASLSLMGTPDTVIKESILYMRIYFLGTPFFMLYNFGAAVLRAVGDTKRPMIFLIIAGFVNAGLNMVLVIVFHMGVSGVAIATIFSQFISCVCVLVVLFKSPEGYRLYIRKLGINPRILAQLLAIGVPAGLQSTVISVSNAMLQSSVNSFGEYAMSGYTAANNILGFLYMSVNAVTQGCMSFTSQNMGAGKRDRMRKVLFNCLILEFIVALSLGSVAFFFGRNLLHIYTASDVAVEFGFSILSVSTLTYFFCGFMDCIPGSLRGMGQSSVPMILSIIGTVGVRIIWIYGVFPHHRTLQFLFISYPASWIATFIMQTVCYFFVEKKVGKRMQKTTPA